LFLGRAVLSNIVKGVSKVHIEKNSPHRQEDNRRPILVITDNLKYSARSSAAIRATVSPACDGGGFSAMNVRLLI